MSIPCRPFVLPADLTIYEAALLKDALLEWIQQPGEGYEIDGAAVEHIDLAGLQVLLMLMAHAKRVNKSVQLRAASPALTQTLEMLHLPFQSHAHP